MRYQQSFVAFCDAMRLFTHLSALVISIAVAHTDFVAQMKDAPFQAANVLAPSAPSRTSTKSQAEVSVAAITSATTHVTFLALALCVA